MLAIHPNARTTPAVRAEIARSAEPTGELARRYGVTTETIRKRRILVPAHHVIGRGEHKAALFAPGMLQKIRRHVEGGGGFGPARIGIGIARGEMHHSIGFCYCVLPGPVARVRKVA